MADLGILLIFGFLVIVAVYFLNLDGQDDDK